MVQPTFSSLTHDKPMDMENGDDDTIINRINDIRIFSIQLQILFTYNYCISVSTMY